MVFLVGSPIETGSEVYLESSIPNDVPLAIYATLKCGLSPELGKYLDSDKSVAEVYHDGSTTWFPSPAIKQEIGWVFSV